MIKEILDERGNRYGEFAEHARITQEIKDTLVSGCSWEKCSDSQREALEMIAHKLGRIVNGDPDYDDSWIDIIGYTQLVLDELEDEADIQRVNDEILNEETLSDVGGDLFVGWTTLLDELGKIAEDLNESSEDEPTEEVETEEFSKVEINGVTVFISGSELEKLMALEESEDITKAVEHENQTFMNFGLEDELTYREFLKANGTQS